MNLIKHLARRLAGLAETEPGEGVFSRRNLLLGGAAAIAGAFGERIGDAAPPASSARWLVNRLTLGWTPQEQLLADTLGYHAYVEHHLNHTAIDDSALSVRLQPFFALNLPPYQLKNYNASIITNQLIQTTILRAVYSKRQLYERMVEFWTDHFCIDITKADIPWIKIVDDREVVRAHALGNFADMLEASAKSPSMLLYLDNATSTVGNPNENYARELMELHTMGVSGGYTQQDVVEVARCFTGWTVDDSDTNAQNTFLYRSDWHDDGAKVVLGNIIPAGGGLNDALIVLDILAHHPSTANFIATKLCKRFFGYDPPVGLINSVAATFSSSDFDIKATMRTLLNAIDPATATPKIKRPFHLFVSAMRSVNAELTGSQYDFNSAIRLNLQAAGHEPFFHGPPDGYPDSLEAWSGLVLPRWNFVSSMMNGDVPGVSVDIDALTAGASTAQQALDRINEVILGGAMTAAEKSAILAYLQPDLPTSQKKREAAALAMVTPSFQWY